MITERVIDKAFNGNKDRRLVFNGKTVSAGDLLQDLQKLAGEIAGLGITGSTIAVEPGNPCSAITGALAATMSGNGFTFYDKRYDLQAAGVQYYYADHVLKPVPDNHLHCSSYRYDLRGNDMESAAGTITGPYFNEWLQFLTAVLEIDFSSTVIVQDQQADTGLFMLAAFCSGGSIVSLKEQELTMQQNDNGTLVISMRSLLNLSSEKLLLLRKYKCVLSYGEETGDVQGLQIFLRGHGIKWYNLYGFPFMNIVTRITEDVNAEERFLHTGLPARGQKAWAVDADGQPISGEFWGNLEVSGSCTIGGMEAPAGYRVKWQNNKRMTLKKRGLNYFTQQSLRIGAREIESVLYQLEGVRGCKVVFHDNIAHAYVQYQADELAYSLVENLLRKYFSESITENIRVFLTLHFPRTQNGLIDAARLRTDLAIDLKELQQIRELAEPLLKNSEWTISAGFYSEEPPRIPIRLPAAINAKKQDTASPQPTGKKAIAGGGDPGTDAADPRLLHEILDRAALTGNSIVVIEEDGTESVISYKELQQAARDTAGRLLASGVTAGSIVMLIFQSRVEFIKAFWACTYGGFIAAPVAVPRAGNELAIFQNLAAFLDGPVIFTERAVLALLSAGDNYRIFLSEELVQLPSTGFSQQDSSPHQPALLLTTSGSVGTPKVIAHSHTALLHRSKATNIYNNHSQQDITLNWMPLEHVGGIVMYHIKEVYLGCAQIQVATNFILSKPLRWPGLISRFKVSNTWAPNFAFALLCEHYSDKSEFDLSSVRYLLNGGEMINPLTANRFLKMFGRYGLRPSAMKPAWGMTETCSGVIFADHFAADDNNKFTRLGKTIPGVWMRIADDNDSTVNEGMSGNLQVKGPCVISSYYKNPELTGRFFTADGWLKTGDIGFIQDDTLVLTGREQDILIFNGINYYSMEIENQLNKIAGLHPDYTVAGSYREGESGEEKLVVFFNSRHTEQEKIWQQVAGIKSTMLNIFRLTPAAIIPLQQTDYPRTAIGKKKKSKLIEAFLRGDLNSSLRTFSLANANTDTIPQSFYYRDIARTELAFPLTTQNRTVLIIGNQDSNAKELCGQLSASGWQWTLVSPNEKDIDEILQQAEKIISLQLYSPAVAGDAVETSISHFLDLYKALSKTGKKHQLYIVSNNAALYEGVQQLHYTKTFITGLIKTIKAEADNLTVHHIDFQNYDPQSDSKLLLQELHFAGEEVIYKNAERYTPVYRPIQVNGVSSAYIPEGVYILTGGLGGLGFVLAKYLLTRYNIKLVIIGKTGLAGSPDREKRFLELTAISDDLVYEQGNIADLAFVESVYTKTIARWGNKIAGVFHLAGAGNLEYHWTVTEKHLLKQERMETFRQMMEAKYYGTKNLHQVFLKNKDMLFVCYSSTNSHLGAGSFSAYASANSLLNGYIGYLRAAGYSKALAIGWSQWDNIGMSSNNPMHMVRALEQHGLLVISIQQGLFALSALLQQSYANPLVGINAANAGMQRVINDFTSVKPKIKISWSGSVEVKDELLRVFAGAGLKNQLPELGYTGNGQERAAEHWPGYEKIHAIWCAALRRNHINETDNFFDTGGNSLKMLEVIHQVNEQFGLKIPVTAVFSYPQFREFTRFIKEQQSGNELHIPKAAVQAGYPASFSQQRMYFLSKFNERSTAYNTLQVYKIEGSLNAGRLERAINRLVEKHEPLRTSFFVNEGRVSMKVLERYEFRLPITIADEEDLHDYFKTRPFFIDGFPLFRIELYRCGAAYYLLMDMHHIITDAWSNSIFFRDLINIYLERAVPETTLTYKDFAAWQLTASYEALMMRQKEFWLSRFNDEELPVLNLGADKPRPASFSFAGNFVQSSLDIQTTSSLKAIAARHKATSFMMLYALYNVLLSKLSGADDIIIGVPVSGRTHPGLQEVTGLFVNTLPFRVPVEREESFASLLQRIKQFSVEAFGNQDLPIEELIRALKIERDLSRNPLFDVLFSFLDFDRIDTSGFSGSDLRIAPYPSRRSNAAVDLTLIASEKDGRFTLRFEYYSDVFARSTIEQFASAFKVIAETVATDEDIMTRDIPLLAADKLRPETEPVSIASPDHTMVSMFLEQVKMNASHTALVFNDENISYSSLYYRALSYAEQIRKTGIEKQSVIAIRVHRGVEMISSMLGVMLSGCAYLPIDPDLPMERALYIVEHASASAVILSQQDALRHHCKREICIEEVPIFSDATIDWELPSPTDLAYIMYTSGSTGLPKGVAIEHRSIVNTLSWRSKYYGFGASDATLQVPAYWFDSSVEDIFTPLVSGSRLVLTTVRIFSDISYLLDLCRSQEVTNLLMVPGLYREVLSRIKEPGALRFVTLAGESISEDIVASHFEILPNVELHNEYGPTECSVCATVHRFTKDRTKVLIGHPVTNINCYVLNRDMNYCPPGVPGELYLSGAGLARGYYRNEEQTERSFIPKLNGEGLMYKTGDVVKWNEQGELEFLGRNDDQVKLRGFRIETAEIEHRLLQYGTIKEAVVVKDSQREILCAYFRASEEIPVREIKAWLSARLPAYMVPGHIQQLEALPRTSTGKINRKKLGAPAPEKREETTMPVLNELEQKLLALWRRAVNTENVQAHENFFESGGNSINILSFQGRLQLELGINVPVDKFFQYPNVLQLAAFISTEVNTPVATTAPLEELSDKILLSFN